MSREAAEKEEREKEAARQRELKQAKALAEACLLSEGIYAEWYQHNVSATNNCPNVISKHSLFAS